MEYRVRVNWFSAAAVIALGVAASIITSTAVAARAYESRVKESARTNRELTVKGSTRTRVRSDLGVWTISVRGEGKELQEAFTILDDGVARVQAFLTDKGFADPEVGLSAIATTTFYARDAKGVETREVTGYGLDRTFTVTTAEVNRIATAAGEVTQLIRDNVKVVSYRPAYYYTKAADLKVQILGEATKDARARADEIARNSGCRVGDVRRVQMGVIQITEPNSTDVSSGGVYDTGTIEKDVSVVVTLTLGVEG
jgi:uncharacterized protein